MRFQLFSKGWLMGVMTLVTAASLEACGGSDAPIEENVKVAADGVKGITDSAFDPLFSGGNAAKGVADLIANGQVKINGTQIPPATGNKLDINDGRGLWKNPDGTWSWDVHVLFKGANKPYEDAVVGFVNHTTMLRGIEYTLKKVDGKVTALSVDVMDVALADTITKGASFTTLTTVEKGDNSTDKPNPSSINFPNASVEGAPQSQDAVIYWKDASGWHLKRATPIPSVATVTESNINGALSYTRKLNGVDMTDSRLTLQYSEPWNRPSQPFQAMAWMGENSVNVQAWQSTPGVTVALSRGTSARASLTSALLKSREALTKVQVSATGTGSDVASGQPWVTTHYRDTFSRAVADAQAILDNPAASPAQVEGALYRLAQAYGGRTGDRNSWLENRYFGKGDDYKRGAPFDTGYNGTGFWTYAQNHLGTAVAGAIAR